MSGEQQYVVWVWGDLTDEVRAAFAESIRGPDGVHGALAICAPRGGPAWESELDSEGSPFFRVFVQGESPQAARERAAEVLESFPSLSVGDARLRTPFDARDGRYDTITYRAIEHLVVELMEGYAAEEERLYRQLHGSDESVLISGYHFAGPASRDPHSRRNVRPAPRSVAPHKKVALEGPGIRGGIPRPRSPSTMDWRFPDARTRWLGAPAAR